ncbi:ATPase, AAA-type, core, P-loop containing nucleoside triphosphate hydrolase [Tanacetum coccineum]
MDTILKRLQGSAEYDRMNVKVPSRTPIHGPNRTGKSSLVHAFAREAKLPFFALQGIEVITSTGVSQRELALISNNIPNSAGARYGGELAPIFKKIGDKQTRSIPEVDISSLLQNASRAVSSDVEREGAGGVGQGSGVTLLSVGAPASRPDPLPATERGRRAGGSGETMRWSELAINSRDESESREMVLRRGRGQGANGLQTDGPESVARWETELTNDGVEAGKNLKGDDPQSANKCHQIDTARENASRELRGGVETQDLLQRLRKPLNVLGAVQKCHGNELTHKRRGICVKWGDPKPNCVAKRKEGDGPDRSGQDSFRPTDDKAVRLRAIASPVDKYNRRSREAPNVEVDGGAGPGGTGIEDRTDSGGDAESAAGADDRGYERKTTNDCVVKFRGDGWLLYRVNARNLCACSAEVDDESTSCGCARLPPRLTDLADWTERSWDATGADGRVRPGPAKMQ